VAGVKWERTGEPGIYRREGPRGRHYRVVIRDATGRQVARNFARLQDARDFKASGRTDRPHDVAAGRRTLRQVYGELVDSRDYAVATLDFHETAWRVHLGSLADVSVKDITSAHIDAVLKPITGKAMRDKVRVFLSTVFGYAMRRRYIAANPVPRPEQDSTRAARMRKDGTRSESKRHKLTTQDIARLVDETPERYRALVKLMAFEGLRPGEAVSLTVGKLDPIKRTLVVDTSTSGFTKTGRPRTLVLPVPLVEVLTEHLARFTDPTDPEAPMFPKDDGNGITTKNAYDAWVRRTFGPAAKRAGINDGLSPNDLRHFAASLAIHNGANVYHVQKMLGHARPSITLDIYGDEWESSAEEHAERMEPVIREALSVEPTEAKVMRL